MNVLKPELTELLRLVEQRYRKTLRTTTDFDEFSLYLKTNMNEVISTSTLKRLWGYVNDLHTPRVHTLDVLARYLGYDNYAAFCLWLKTSTAYNSSFFSARQLLSSELNPGAELEIGWAPNRLIRLRYEGDGCYVVVKSEQSKLQLEDRFVSSSFLLGQPLSLPYILRNGERTSPFIAGRNGGLTLLQLVNHSE